MYDDIIWIYSFSGTYLLPYTIHFLKCDARARDATASLIFRGFPQLLDNLDNFPGRSSFFSRPHFTFIFSVGLLEARGGRGRGNSGVTFNALRCL